MSYVYNQNNICNNGFGIQFFNYNPENWIICVTKNNICNESETSMSVFGLQQ